MNNEAIEKIILENQIAIMKFLNDFCSPKDMVEARKTISQAVVFSDEALALMQKPVCKTCGGRGKVNVFLSDKNEFAEKKPCPYCAKPDSGEFARKMDELLRSTSQTDTNFMLWKGLEQACDLIDSQAATIKEQAEQIKSLSETNGWDRVHDLEQENGRYFEQITELQKEIEMEIDRTQAIIDLTAEPERNNTAYFLLRAKQIISGLKAQQ